MILILLFSGLRCQELLTVEQAVSIGLTNNYGIIISQNQLEQAKNNATRGNAGMLPEVGLNAGFTKAFNNVKMEVVTGSKLDEPNAQSDLLTAGLGMNWRIFDGLNMFITYDKLRKVEEASDLSAKITVENTVAGIIAAYYEIVKQERILRMLEEQVDISKFKMEIAKMRFETGTGSEMDYLKSRVELNADIANLSKQNTLAENSKTMLNDLLSRDVRTPFAVEDSIPAGKELVYESLLTSMGESNRNLQLARKNKQVGELDVKSAAAVQWPTLTWFAGLNYYRNETDAHFIKYNRYFGPATGLSLNMNLFDGLNQRRQYRNSLLALETYDVTVKQAENRLASLLLQIYNEYRNQVELSGFEVENLDLALRNMELAKESYSVGSISDLQLREVKEDLLNARSRLIIAQTNVKMTETELLLLAGRLVE